MKKPTTRPSATGWRWAALAGICVLLAACGGSQGEEPQAKDSPAQSQAQTGGASAPAPGESLRPAVSLEQLAQGGSAPGPASARDAAHLAQGARLNQSSLSAAEQQAQALDQASAAAGNAVGEGNEVMAAPLAELQPGQIAGKSAYASGRVAAAAAAVRIPTYRFYNSTTGAHFFTTNETERDNIVANLSPPFALEGPAFSVASAFSPGLSPVHRFYNTQTGVHFYTITESERANVVANLPHFTYEGVAYHASEVAGAGLTAFHRFFVPSRGFHFYTASESEKDGIIANLSATYTYEGVGYHVLASDWRAEKLPHSGVTSNQCYQAGNNTLTACSNSTATALSGTAKQDGMRASRNAMSYSPVGSQLVTACVRDNITGLIWEGKTDDGGLRDKDNTYKNLGGGAATDTSGYVAAVNASNLCGFNDWRLPTRAELLNLVDNGKTGSAPINATAFSNTALTDYWSADVRRDFKSRAWTVSFLSNGGSSSDLVRSSTRAVRLVRGSAASGPRYSFSSVAYSANGQVDAANNLVNDAWTGLQWRRCEEGRVWSGSACTGNASAFTHEQALGHARNQSGWRLPNVKDLASLVDLSVNGSAMRVDPVAFPGAAADFTWSSSPFVGDSRGAWVVGFGNGDVDFSVRYGTLRVRLVRASQ